MELHIPPRAIGAAGRSNLRGWDDKISEGKSGGLYGLGLREHIFHLAEKRAALRFVLHRRDALHFL